KRLNLEAERGHTFSGDLGAFVDGQWADLAREPSPRRAALRLLQQIEARARLNGGPAWKLFALLADDDFAPPAAAVRGALLRAADVPPTYLSARDKDPRDVAPYLAETKRRAAAGDVD